jgi:hypothetical protein
MLTSSSTWFIADKRSQNTFIGCEVEILKFSYNLFNHNPKYMYDQFVLVSCECLSEPGPCGCEPC